MRKTVFSLLSLALLTAPALAAPNATADAPAFTRVAITATTPGLETAEQLLAALTRRSVELQERGSVSKHDIAPPPRVHQSAPPSGGGLLPAPPITSEHEGYSRGVLPPPPEPRHLSSRMSGPASHRLHGSFAPATDLAGLVAIQSHFAKNPMVTGRFSDWRSPSIYRLVAGRHNGYDIAMDAGSTAVAGWPGRVTAIANWTAREYGITVVSPDGFSVTYGHLAPAVRVGNYVEPGDVVGIVVRDHCDVKMRDAQGHFIDFAHGVPLSAASRADVGSGDAATYGINVDSVSLPAAAAAPLAGPDWTLKPEAVKAAIAYVRLRHREATLVNSQGAVAEIAQVRRDIADARSRLLLYGVPEELLLAAFLDAPSMQNGEFGMGDAVEVSTNSADKLGEWLRRQQVTRDARYAVSDLKRLLRDLND